jgi:hypothetical protein
MTVPHHSILRPLTAEVARDQRISCRAPHHRPHLRTGKTSGPAYSRALDVYEMPKCGGAGDVGSEGCQLARYEGLVSRFRDFGRRHGAVVSRPEHIASCPGRIVSRPRRLVERSEALVSRPERVG